MKKTVIVFGIILLFTCNTKIVYAGSINQNESAVVSVAKGQFESNGVRYQADQAYLNELVSYLSQDDVDLSAEQKDEAIASIYANVEKGIEEGYLVPIKTENTGQESSNTDSALQGTDTIETEESNTDQSNLESNDEINKAGATDKAAGKDFDKFVKDIMKKSPATTETDRVNSKITVIDKSDKQILTVNTVIKNTGFNLNQTVFMAIGMVMIMTVCIIVTCKYHLFAHDDE